MAMVRISMLLLCLCNLMLPSEVWASASNPAPSKALQPSGLIDLRLQVGEAQNVELAGRREARISRKGIVQAYYQGESRWLVIALKPGFVVMDSPGDEGSKIYRIEVLPKDQDKPRSKRGSAANASPESAKKSIAMNLDAMQDRLLAAFSDLRIKRQDEILQVHIDCRVHPRDERRKEIDYLLHGMERKGFVRVLCSEELEEEETYGLRAYLVKSEEASMSRKDLISLLDNTRDLAQMRFDKIDYEQRKVRGQMIAEPLIPFRIGETARVASGGEIESVSRHEENSTVERDWKSYGMELKFSVERAAKDRFWLSYRFSLSSPSQRSTRLTIEGASLSSKILLKLGELRQIGLADLNSLQNETESLWFWSQIPIIGPLFRPKSESTQFTHLFAWARLEKLPP